MPAFLPVATPAFTVARVRLALDQVAVVVRVGVAPSDMVPLRVRFVVRPAATVGAVSTMAMPVSIGALTVSTVVSVLTETVSVADMVVVPTAAAVARPAGEMVAVASVPLVQVTPVVRGAVVLSVYIAVAVNCTVPPLKMNGLSGVTFKEATAGAVTVSTTAGLVMVTGGVAVFSIEAVILVVPTARAAAKPVVEIVAVAGVPLVKVTPVVKGAVEPSEKVPVAVNCSVKPLATVGLG